MTERPAPIFVNSLKFEMTLDGTARLGFSDVVEGQADRHAASIVTTVANAEAFANMILRVIAEVRDREEAASATKQ